MNSNNPFSLIQQGFRVTVGAAVSLVETLQDSQKRNSAFSDLKEELDQKTKEWATKGETTEQEARKMLEELWKKQGKSPKTETASQSSPITVDTTVVNDDPKTEIWELTQQIIALRNELEQLRESEK